MYGWPFSHGRPNPATWIIERLQSGERVNVVTDVQENPLWFYQCAEAIWRTIDWKIAGTIHVAGRDMVNRYEFARLVAQVFGLDETLIHAVDSSYFPALAARPANTSFVTERMEQELELKPLSLEEGLGRMRSLASGMSVLYSHGST
jgi:dTDP-4-dehydrorhamnose reductase